MAAQLTIPARRLMQPRPLIGCFLHRASASSAVSISDWTVTKLTCWDTEEYDTHGFYNLAAGTGEVTIPVGQDGTYLVTAQVNWLYSYQPNVTQAYLALRRIKLNATDEQIALAYGNQGMVINTVLQLLAGEKLYLETYFRHTSSGSPAQLSSYRDRELQWSVTRIGSYSA